MMIFALRSLWRWSRITLALRIRKSLRFVSILQSALEQKNKSLTLVIYVFQCCNWGMRRAWVMKLQFLGFFVPGSISLVILAKLLDLFPAVKRWWWSQLEVDEDQVVVIHQLPLFKAKSCSVSSSCISIAPKSSALISPLSIASWACSHFPFSLGHHALPN